MFDEIEGACDCFGTLPAFARDCDGNCVLDADGDGICDDLDECHPGLAQSDELQYRLSVEEYNVVSWARLIAFTSMPRMTPINSRRCLATTIGLFGSTPRTASTMMPSTHLGTPQASIVALFGFSQTWNTTATAPSGLEGPAPPLQVQKTLPRAGLRSDTHSEQLLSNGRHPTQRQHAHRGVLVRVEHGSQRLPTDGRWLIAQITTSGTISGTINYQIFPFGRRCQRNPKISLL